MNPNSVESGRYHLIGIGGAGMSVVAELLFESGAQVSGSDRQDSKILRDLQDLGIDAYHPHDAKDFDEDAVVILSSAIRDNNPELIKARERGQKVIHRSQGLAIAARGQKFVAVAGAHGKTTTTAMIAVALQESGIDASFAVGSGIVGRGSGAHRGSGIFLAEADESDRSFLNYSPKIALVTNIEADHLDNYGSADGLDEVFEQFSRRIVPGGTLVCCAEDRGSARLARKVMESDFARQNQILVLTYGRPEQSLLEPSVAIHDLSTNAQGARASITSKDASVAGGLGDTYELELSVSGEHNVLNATGAWTVCAQLGVDPELAARSLAEFHGASRRFEVRGRVGGRTLIDDYAHHPTEVASSVRQARAFADGGQVIVVFQPHLYSRTNSFADRFAAELAIADQVVVADIYAAREDPVEGITSKLISDAAWASGVDESRFVLGGPVAEAAAFGGRLTKPGDVCILMGAGDIFLEADAVLNAWRLSDGGDQDPRET